MFTIRSKYGLCYSVVLQTLKTGKNPLAPFINYYRYEKLICSNIFCIIFKITSFRYQSYYDLSMKNLFYFLNFYKRFAKEIRIQFQCIYRSKCFLLLSSSSSSSLLFYSFKTNNII